jgi:rod shape-determining protein MreD
MRRTVLAVVTVAVAVIVQLTVLNGLALPGGGVPDLVLVLVAALAITNGPVRGMITGFLAGLVLDLAPPGSAVLGEYALVFCLVGWAAGSLSGLVAKSAVRSLLMLAGIVAVGEAIVAGIDRALDPAQVSVTQIRHVLPYSVAYDFFLIPFVLAAALVGTAWASRQHVDPLEAAGVPAAESALVMSRRRPARPKPREVRLAQGNGRPHDGWVGSRPSGLDSHTGKGRPAPVRRPAAPRRLRPASGVAGSAFDGPPRQPGLAARPVHLRLASGRRGDGALGNPVGGGLRRHPDLHAGPRAAAHFRPHGGAPGGSAAGQFAAMVRHPPSGPAGRGPAAVRFRRRRGDASVGRRLGAGALTSAGIAQSIGAGRSAPALKLGRSSRPRFRLGLSAARSSRKAVPNFRRAARSGSSVAGAARVSGGTLDQATFVAMRRRQTGAPALHLRAGHRGDGVLGGGRQARLASPRFKARPPRRSGTSSGRRQPRFGYGRRSLLAFLATRGVGGSWLARKRAGTRSSASLIRRRESVE